MPTLGPAAAAWIFAVALGVRLIATALVGFSTLEFGDARAYVSTAHALVETGRYPIRTEPYFFRPPGYPVFLALATVGHPEAIAAGKVVNGTLGAASCLLLSLLSLRLFRRRDVAIATGVAASLHPGFIMTSTEIQSEPLFLLLLLGAGFFLLVAVDRPSSNSAVLAGACLALAALTRSTALVLAPFLLAPLADSRFPPRVRRHLAFSALLGLVLALAPWTIRNAIVFGEWLPINDAGGFSLYHGNSAWTRRYYEIRSIPEYKRWLAAFDADLRARMTRVDPQEILLPGERSRVFARMAIEESAADPAAALRLLALKAWQWIRPFPTPWFWPTGIVLGVGALYLALEVFAAIGLATAPRAGVAVFCAGVLAVTMLAHVFLLVVWRYRVPYWDPILLLFAVPAAWALCGRRMASRGLPV